VLPVALVLLSPPDTFPLFVNKISETPVAWDVRAKRRRAMVASIPPSFQWGSRLAAYLPATTYPDTACRIYSEIQRHLLESPIDGGLTWSLWTADEVRGYLLQRLARFMVDTGLIRERRDVTGVTDRNVTLPSDSLEVLRTVWNEAGTRNVLIRADKWTLDNGAVGWETTTGTPVYYSEDTSSALGAEVAPTPSVPGTLELVIIAAPTLEKRCSSINLPAIFTPYIKYGVMADMLSKQGEANDPQRATYCESRFSEGVELAKLFFAGGLSS
jgi:hypothetical protein